MVSAREINQAGIPQAGATWQNTHLVYTHGYGAVAAQVNTATTEGAPRPHPQGHADRPRERARDGAAARSTSARADRATFVVANANGELDFEGVEREPRPTAGLGGIPIENIFRRALFAWNFKDVNLLISNQITDQSRL